MIENLNYDYPILANALMFKHQRNLVLSVLDFLIRRAAMSSFTTIHTLLY